MNITKIEYHGLNQYLKSKYGHKVYKVAINGNFTCPNRDGTVGTRGCIFCSGKGSGDFCPEGSLSVKSQLDEGISRIEKKIGAQGVCTYIAYFQAFTNTYGPIEKLKKLFYEAIEDERVEILSIATRPDCLSDEVVFLLAELNKFKPVWVELGLQTIHEKSARYIRRGYELSVYDEAVRNLKAAGIAVITHVILGLKDESPEDMVKTVEYVAKTGTFGIKLQLLHVLKDTDLYEEYLAGKVKTLSLQEYIDILVKCVSVLPDDMIVHRLTGDGDKKILAAPLWSADKKHVLNEISKYLKPI